VLNSIEVDMDPAVDGFLWMDGNSKGAEAEPFMVVPGVDERLLGLGWVGNVAIYASLRR